MDMHTLNVEQMHLGERAVPVDADESIKNTLKALADSDRDILAQYPANAMKLKIQEKMAQSANTQCDTQKNVIRFPGLNMSRVTRFAAVAAALCLAVLLPLTLGAFNNDLPDGIRAKGEARLFVYRQNGDEAERLSSGAGAKSGDVIQLSYVAAGAKYGVIISIDGNGSITRHYPDGGALAGKLTQGREVPLPFSYKLDDAPDYERFVLFYSEKPFPISVLSSMDNGFVDASNGRDFDFSALMPRSVKISDFVLIK